MRTLNLGILAHVDAGKTTLSERLLFTAGAIDHVGSVDAGTTQTDSLDLERERGITIRSAVASFLVGDLAVNLVDTPGHPDFIAEVERVLGVLDGAVLVVSAVEGVQPQTPLLFRALQRLDVPTLIFVNKIDRAGADAGRVVEAMRAPALARRSCRWRRPDPARREAAVVPFGATMRPSDGAHRGPRRARRGDPRARTSATRLACRIRACASSSPARRAGASSIRCSSARPRSGRRRRALAGVDELLRGAGGDPDAPVSGRVFKIERTTVGERVAYARLFAGTLRPRQRVPRRRGRGGEGDARSGLRPDRRATPRRRRGRRDGDDPGLGAVRVGDAIGEPRRARRRPPASRGRRSRRSSSPGRRSSRARSGRPSPSSPSRIRSSTSARTTTATRSRSRSTARSRRRSSRRRSSATTASPPTSARRRRSASSGRRGVGEADEVIQAKTKTNITGRSSPLSTNPFMATLALRIEPAPPGSGIEFRHDVEPRLIPLYLFKTPDDVRRPDGGVRPRGAGRGPGRLAGDRLPGHDDRLRLRLAGHLGGRLPAAHPARADDRAGAGRDVGLRAALGPHAGGAGVDGAGRRRGARPARRAGHAASSRRTGCRRSARSCRSPASAALQHQLPGPVDGGGDPRERAPAATSRSAATRRAARGRRRARWTATPGSRHWRSAGPRPAARGRSAPGCP